MRSTSRKAPAPDAASRARATLAPEVAQVMARPEASALRVAPAEMAAPASTAILSPEPPAARATPRVLASAPAWAPAGVVKRQAETVPVRAWVRVRTAKFWVLMAGSDQAATAASAAR